jgi:hypothetical protein
MLPSGQNIGRLTQKKPIEKHSKNIINLINLGNAMLPTQKRQQKSTHSSYILILIN